MELRSPLAERSFLSQCTVPRKDGRTAGGTADMGARLVPPLTLAPTGGLTRLRGPRGLTLTCTSLLHASEGTAPS